MDLIHNACNTIESDFPPDLVLSDDSEVSEELRQAAVKATDELEEAFDLLKFCVGVDIDNDELGGELTIFLDIITLVSRAVR